MQRSACRMLHHYSRGRTATASALTVHLLHSPPLPPVTTASHSPQYFTGCFSATPPRLLPFRWPMSKSKRRRGGRLSQRMRNSEEFISRMADGLGGAGVGRGVAFPISSDGKHKSESDVRSELMSGLDSGLSSAASRGNKFTGDRGPPAQLTEEKMARAMKAAASHPDSDAAMNRILFPEESALRRANANGGGPVDVNDREPISYEMAIARRNQEKAAAQAALDEEYAKLYDENNMPRHPDDPNRTLEHWEFEPTPEHKALVLLLYRSILKGLVNFKSVRRRSLIAYTRMAFRRRAAATEKLLVDECVEEARRAMYIIGKHHMFTETHEYEFDSMTLPKDTGQDVKTYMEEVYDPEVSRMQFKNYTDVQPGKEHLHTSPRPQGSAANYKVEITEQDKVLRPPPPPNL